ncbi:MAG: ribonuclease HII [Bacteroidota bacterium]|nr:ribonuclease HII [Bacteroidota bacterium]
MTLNNDNMFDGRLTAGCDEAGRGCLAGPVFAAAVILPDDYANDILNDSKQLNEKTRFTLREEIETKSMAWAVAFVPPFEIDKINILHASIKAMHLALSKLKQVPEAILVDGNKFKPWLDKPYRCIVGGDGIIASIAAASILAKTYRDDYMVKLHREFPAYGWDHNKGYPTKIHRRGIEENGISPHHRRSFRLTDTQQKIAFDNKK